MTTTMTEPTTTVAALEQDGFIHVIASACVQATREVAAAATPERLIRRAASQMTEVGELTPECVAAHLHTTLRALSAVADQLREADTDCARNPENPGAAPQ
jgi:hypothetical protein